MPENIETTESDVNLDILAALESYDGLCGSESTTIESIAPGEHDSIVIVLSNGNEYRLITRRI